MVSTFLAREVHSNYLQEITYAFYLYGHKVHSKSLQEIHRLPVSYAVSMGQGFQIL